MHNLIRATCLTAIAALMATSAMALDMGIKAATTSSGASLSRPEYTSGYWYPGFNATTTNSTNYGVGSQYFVPIIVDRPITITNLGMRVTTAGSNTDVAMALYASDPTTGSPTTIITSATATINVSSTGGKDFTLNTPVTLSPGTIYYGSFIVSATVGTSPTFTAYSITGAHNAYNTLKGSTALTNALSTTGSCGWVATGANFANGPSSTIPNNILNAYGATMPTIGFKVQ